MAPEVFGEKVTYNYKIDIWGLGIVAYFLVTGDIPFNSPSMSELESLIKNGEYKQDTWAW